ncbi:MAG: hypothetical protein JFR41_03420 [Muribaculaceae bacterium]|nr:hypothetical protein [Muribaculaceae bacterium]
MWLYIKQLFQLILSPSRGWEDVSESGVLARKLQEKGFYPFLGVTAVSEFLRLLYTHDLGFWSVVLSAIAVAGAMFVSLYLARLFLDMTAERFINGTLNAAKVDVFVTYMMGINCLFRVFENAMPASMTFLKFLPLISLIIIFKSNAYMSVKADSQLNFLGLAGVALIVLPWAVGLLLSIII